MSLISKAIGLILKPFWRLTRGMTMGAQAVVIDQQNQILLVRHGYRPGWHFPGGGVEWNEALSVAMARELFEETGVKITGEAKFHGLFTNFKTFKGDHIGVFIIKQWQQPTVPKPNAEIVEIGFFSQNALPEHTVEGVKNRLNEIFNSAPISTTW